MYSYECYDGASCRKSFSNWRRVDRCDTHVFRRCKYEEILWQNEILRYEDLASENL